MVISEIELYEMLKTKIGDKEAGAFVHILEKRVDKKFEEAKQYLATKEDVANAKSEIMRSIYVVGLIQFLAVVGSVLAVVNFMLK